MSQSFSLFALAPEFLSLVFCRKNLNSTDLDEFNYIFKPEQRLGNDRVCFSLSCRLREGSPPVGDGNQMSKITSVGKRKGSHLTFRALKKSTGGRRVGRRSAAQVDRLRQEHAGRVLLSADQADRLR